MIQNKTEKQLVIKGMTCSGCEMRIEKRLKDLDGVLKVKASYHKGMVYITYEESQVSLSKIKRTIAELSYEVIENSVSEGQKKQGGYFKLALIAIIILGLSKLIEFLGGFSFFQYFPEAKIGMSYATIFVIGLLTSVHCVGMCGGICLAQCVGTKSRSKVDRIRPSLLYNFGRIISYTIVGGIVGTIGSVVSFNGTMRGAVAVFAGILMVLMGLNMLDVVPWLRKFSIRMPRFLTGGMEGKRNRPFYVGLLNGLMPCGPLQAMQLYALSTGSMVQGATSMLVFALGTSFLMFGFGAISAMLSQKLTSKMAAVSAVLVVILGVGMLNTGLNMSGFFVIGTETSDTEKFEPMIEDGYQIVQIEVSSRSYTPITVKKDIPVKFNLHVEEENLSGCNNAIRIPKYGIEKKLLPGDNVVEFTPTETERIPYSCWMNMIRSSITVVE